MTTNVLIFHLPCLCLLLVTWPGPPSKNSPPFLSMAICSFPFNSVTVNICLLPLHTLHIWDLHVCSSALFSLHSPSSLTISSTFWALSECWDDPQHSVSGLIIASVSTWIQVPHLQTSVLYKESLWYLKTPIISKLNPGSSISRFHLLFMFPTYF